MVIKIKIFLILFILLLFNKSLFASQIIDFETEIYIKHLIDKTKNINNIKKVIKFKIISDQNINAFVNENNIIHITSGLIEYSPDYVALLAVLAHEIGHVDKNHIITRKSSIKNIKHLRNISNMSIIAGSMISNNPELLQGLAIREASISNYYINFSKEQEREADIYSINTLKKLKVNSNSIIELIEIIEKKALEKGLNREKQRISTHPYFEERKSLINFLNKSSNSNIDNDLNKNFNFIRAKFLGYSENKSIINFLDEPYKSYAEAIVEAKNGNLINAMKKINKLIKQNKNNIFILETKADILFSYGYTNESIKFYKKVLEKVPNNYYTQIRIFENTNFDNMSKSELEDIFLKNQNLLKRYIYNRNILITYFKLSKICKKGEWINFFNFWLNNNLKDYEILKKELDDFKKTKDENLIELINLIASK